MQQMSLEIKHTNRGPNLELLTQRIENGRSTC